jgi:hypothetical protein
MPKQVITSQKNMLTLLCQSKGASHASEPWEEKPELCPLPPELDCRGFGKYFVVKYAQSELIWLRKSSVHL